MTDVCFNSPYIRVVFGLAAKEPIMAPVQGAVGATNGMVSTLGAFLSYDFSATVCAKKCIS